MSKLLDRYRIDEPEKFRLADFKTDETCGLGKDEGEKLLAAGLKRLADLQQRLYAEDRWSVLVALQGLDAAGKDGVIAHVMSGINPQGCEVHSFKRPSPEELDHNFLWRVARRLPERGRIGIFNRSHYEEVLVVRVHPDLLKRQKLPPELIGKDVWKERFKDIRSFERHLARNGTLVLKFYLHLSKGEQRRRFLDRLEEPNKRWKFSMDDIAERAHWEDYMSAYEDAIQSTSQPEAPWYIVPADHKWFARLVVAEALIDALDRLDLRVPKIEGAALKELEKVRTTLLHEGGSG